MDVVHCFSSAYINRKINKIQTNRMLLIPIHLLTRWPSGDNPMCKYFGRRKKKSGSKGQGRRENGRLQCRKRIFLFFNAPVVKRLYRMKKKERKSSADREKEGTWWEKKNKTKGNCRRRSAAAVFFFCGRPGDPKRRRPRMITGEIIGEDVFSTLHDTPSCV